MFFFLLLASLEMRGAKLRLSASALCQTSSLILMSFFFLVDVCVTGSSSERPLQWC